MNIKEIKEIINLMNENGLSEFELEREGLRIRLRKGPGGEGIEKIVMAAPVASSGSLELLKAEASAEAKVQKKGIEVKAPMVGTFYRAPSPDAPPFVEVGSSVETGQVLCIIEAMKLMNEIKSEVKGKILEVLIENGDPVEFGTVLFLVESG